MGKKRTQNESLFSVKSDTLKVPASVEVEALVIGAMLIDREAIPKTLEILKPIDFYKPEHKLIYEAIISLFDSNEQIDPLAISEELRKIDSLEKIGGIPYLNDLAQNISSVANIDYHLRVILEKSILRKLIQSSLSIAESAYHAQEDVFDILDEAEKQIFNISQEGLRESFKPMNRAVKDAIEYIEAIHSQNIKSFSVPSGFVQLDEYLGGFQKSDLVIIAARPSMGKTAFALSIARNAAMNFSKPIGIFSLEMSTLQLVTRIISSEAKIDSYKLRTGKYSADEGSRIARVAYSLSKAPIYIDDSPSQTVLEIRAKARRLKAEKHIEMIIIDYLQLMNATSKMESREREISHISRSLKALAKELNIPVIALAQLNRAVEQRGDKKPMLSDLRESGAIEQDADVVLFLYRPEVYLKEKDSGGEDLNNVAEVIIGKQRNGPTGEVKLTFIKEYAKFENAVFISQHIEAAVNKKTKDNDVPY